MEVTLKITFCIILLQMVLGVTGCITTTPPSIPEMQIDANDNFSMYVSNQSFSLDPVDILVEIDGRMVVNQQFRVGTQHNYTEFRLFLNEGPHKIRIWSNEGSEELIKEFTLNGEDTGLITFWYKPEVTDKKFKFETFKGPFYYL